MNSKLNRLLYLMLIVLVLLFSLLSIAVVSGFFVNIDYSASIITNNSISTELVEFMTAASSIGSPEMLIILGFFISLGLFLKKKEKYALVLFSSVLIGGFLEIILKSLFAIERPLFTALEINSYAFPSGHAALSTVFFIVIAWIFSEHYQRVHNFVFYFVAVAIIILISLSRLYVGAHWFSDVVGGILVGLVAIVISLLLINSLSPERLKLINPFRLFKKM